MRALGILQYEAVDIDAILSQLPKEEAARLYKKNKSYALGSAVGRLLLFFLCDRIFGATAYEKRIAYRQIPNTEKAGAPYLPSHPEIHISISHTDGACAVFLSDEGECGVDIEAITSEKKITETQQQKITEHFSLNDFSIEDTIVCNNLQIYIYILNEKCKISRETRPTNSPIILKKEAEKTKNFLCLYTRMEAVGKAYGLGVSFLSERKKYIDKTQIETFTSDSFVLSIAHKK